MQVDFMVIGAMKCGTTSLASRLAAHPEICFCRLKDPGYFNRTDDWTASLSEYHSLYSPQQGQLCGEASTQYTYLPEWQGTHSRLHAYNPGLKLMYIMRQPVERIVSDYAYRLTRWAVNGPPEVVVPQYPPYINRTRYGVQIRPYLELFGREQVLLLVFEEYVANEPTVMEQVAEFLGVSSHGFATDDEMVVRNRSAGRRYVSPSLQRFRKSAAGRVVVRWAPHFARSAMVRAFERTLEVKPEFSPELRRALWRFLEDDVRTIEALLGRRLDLWREGYIECS